MNEIWIRITGWLRASLLRQFITLIALTGVLLLALNYLFINYYFNNSLINSIQSVEQDYMRMQTDNIEIQMRNYRVKVYEAVLDSELLSLSKQYVMTGKAERAAIDRKIREKLNARLTTTDSIAVSLLMPGEELVFRSRLRDDTSGLSWLAAGQTGYDEALRELCERAKQERNIQIGLTPSHYGTNSIYLMHMACPLFDLYTRQIHGVVVISFNTQTLREMTNPSSAGAARRQSSAGILTDENGVVIVHQRTSEIGKTLYTAQDGASLDPELYSVVNPTDLVLHESMELMGLHMYRVIDRAELLAEPRRFTLMVTLALCLIVAAMLLSVIMIVRKMMRSVRALQRGLQTVQDGKLDVLVKSNTHNEIGGIIGSFNDMALRLKQNDEQRRQQERKAIQALNRQRIAEIKALENQINSHFLYNTLNSINFTALAGGNLEVSRQLKHLAQMLRYTFEKSNGMVTVEREAGWLSEYLSLQKLRFGKVFDYRIRLDDDCALWPMRKLLLQPFVENSLMHGFAGRAHGGLLQIRFQTHDAGRMRVTISDNGCGIQTEKLQSLNAFLSGDASQQDDSGIGLENACLRIKTYYRGEARVLLRSWPGIGTKVVLLLPKYVEEPPGNLR